MIDASNPVLLEYLSKQYSVLALATHGNGIDAPIGDALLCTLQDEENQHIYDPDFLPCANGGPCGRFSSRVGQRPLHSASVLSADVLVWQVCFGVLAKHGPFLPGYSLGQTVLRSPGVRAFITTFRTVESNDSLALYAAALLASGRTLGETCLRLNQATQAMSGITPWILFGHPDSIAEPPGTDDERAPRPALQRAGEEIVLAAGSLTILAGELENPEIVIARESQPGNAPASDLLLRTVPGVGEIIAFHPGSQLFSGFIDSYESTTRPELVDLLLHLYHRGSDTRFARNFVTRVDLDLKGHTRQSFDSSLSIDLQEFEDYCAKASAGFSRGIPLFNVSESQLVDSALSEIGRWEQINQRLCGYLSWYCLTLNKNLGSHYFDESVSNGMTKSAMPCWYCGESVETYQLGVPRLGRSRRQDWCLRCAQMSDLAQEGHDLRIDGQPICVVGTTETYVVRGKLTDIAPMPFYIAACLALKREPWSVGEPGPMKHLWIDKPGEFEIKLDLDIPPSLPAGSHTICASIAAHGDLWLASRPVNVTRTKESEISQTVEG